MALGKQTAFGTAQVDPKKYKAVKITGDSLVAANNPLTANNEIGIGRDITASIPGGFSSAGAVNGNLRLRAASAFLEGAFGTRTAVTAATGPPTVSAYDDFKLGDTLPVYTIEKKVGSSARSANELLVLRYTDAMVNTLNITVPSAAFATFSAGLVACGESILDPTKVVGSGGPVLYTQDSGTDSKVSPEKDPYDVTTNPAGYNPASDDILAFYGGQIILADSTNAAITVAGGTADTTFQSIEVSINNNVMSDEFTVRPSRFLRSLTEGIRAIDLNITQIFANFAQYQKFTYGASANTTPGYTLYMGGVQFSIMNWQINGTDTVISPSAPVGGPAKPQGLIITIPKLAFSGFPVTLTSGRIVVTTTAVALRPGSGDAIEVLARPTDG